MNGFFRVTTLHLALDVPDPLLPPGGPTTNIPFHTPHPVPVTIQPRTCHNFSDDEKRNISFARMHLATMDARSSLCYVYFREIERWRVGESGFMRNWKIKHITWGEGWKFYELRAARSYISVDVGLKVFFSAIILLFRKKRIKLETFVSFQYTNTPTTNYVVKSHEKFPVITP